MSLLNEQYVKVYKDVSAIPSVTSAIILPGKSLNTLNIHSSWAAQDLVKLEKVSFSRHFIFDHEKSSVFSFGFPYDTNSICLQSFNRSGNKQAIVREKNSGKNSTAVYDLEIWNEFQKVKTFELSDHEDHGKINTNAFGCLVWSANERYLLYSAESKQLKSASYFKVPKKDEDKGDKEEKNQNQGQEYIYREEWGEDFVGSHHSVLVILDVETEKTKIITLENQKQSIGEAIWGPDDKSIVFVGYGEFPRRLGVRSCPIRKSGIYLYDCETYNIDCLSAEGEIAVRSPRFSADFKFLIFLENKTGGPHFKASKLQKCDWKTKQISTLVNLVDSSKSDEFPGLYVTSIPKQCWFKNFIFLTSQWRSYQVILAINSDSGTVSKIEPKIPSLPDCKEDTFGESTVLNVQGNFILAEVSSLNIEPCLILGRIQDKAELPIKWQYVDTNAPVKHDYIEWKVLKMHEDKPEKYYEVILVTPAKSDKETKYPSIIRAHGGPHVAYCPAFSKNIAAFTKLNYINCLINYRGSAGFGENSLNSLPGNVGTLDVSDVQEVAEWLKIHPDINISDFFCVGGSHGGFLGAHLIGQYPDFYKAAVLLNPVIDMSAMSTVTDIPDWTWVESGCGDMYNPGAVTNEQQLKSMWIMSPIRYAENVKTPVLLLLGSKDLRVPYSQGLKYYHLLKARNVDVRAYVYEDSHSLRKTPHDADVFMQTALWLQKYSS